MFAFLINAIKIVFLLGLLVFIHEGGHFIVAKLCKVKVNEFALGFGPTIWKKQGKETKYALRLIPLGGFVSMEGEEERSLKEGSFSKAPIIKRIAIVIAGGMVNILFALIIYFCLMTTNTNFITNKVESLIEGNSAQIVGIKPGDEIIKINGKKIVNQEDINEQLLKSKGEKVKVLVKRENQLIEYEIIPHEVKYKETGIYLKEGASTKIVALQDGSPAKEQGLEVNDVILKINDEEVKNNVTKLIDLINKNEQSDLKILVERHGKEKEVIITPKENSRYYLGVNLKRAENTIGNKIYYAFNETIDFCFSIMENLKELFTGKVSKDQLMGPVGISSVVSNTEGIKDYIYIISLISLSLGVTNLLPFPPLDGGKIVLLLIEGVRRKPFKEETEMFIQTAGFFILITLSIYITYNDVLRIF